MTEDLEKLHEDETKQYLKDQKLLEKIKDQTSFEEFDLIKGEVDLSENSSNFRIVDEPTGDLQEQDRVKVWVDQYSVGESGDSFEGTVCMKLPDGKFVMWDYWM